jgi:succinate-acetate transporter protein
MSMRARRRSDEMPEVGDRPSTMGDPIIMGTTIFAFLLAVLGVQLVAVPGAAIATLFAVIAASIAETAAGILTVLRGDAYTGSILAMFGIWLFGFFLLDLVDVTLKIGSPTSTAWYVWILIVPVGYMAIPALVHRNVPLSIAFWTIEALLLLFGIGEVTGSSGALIAGGACSLAAALAVWYIAAERAFAAAGITSLGAHAEQNSAEAGGLQAPSAQS